MRLAACARQNVIDEDDLWEGLPAPPREQLRPPAGRNRNPSRRPSKTWSSSMIAEALQGTKNNQQQAARLLGLSRQGLINKMKRYSL